MIFLQGDLFSKRIGDRRVRLRSFQTGRGFIQGIDPDDFGKAIAASFLKKMLNPSLVL
jgi:hypothetical protein